MTADEEENFNEFRRQFEDNDEPISEGGWSEQSMLEDYNLDPEDNVLEDEITNTEEMCFFPPEHVPGSFPGMQNHDRC